MKDDYEPFQPGETCSVWLPESFQGSHLFTIRNYSLAKETACGECMSSDKFHVGGCWWQIEFYPAGFMNASDHVAIYLSCVIGEIGTRATFKFFLLDQTGGNNHEVFVSPEAHRFGACRRWGATRFMKRSVLEESDFLKDDYLQIRCAIYVFNCAKTVTAFPVKNNPIPFPPSNISFHLQNLLESATGADVIFDVEGDHFPAHKAILAARSSVFSAQFFGLIRDEGGAEPITIHDMKPSVFKVMLHFIYCDELPHSSEFKKLEQKSIYRDLLVAAHRYDIHRLKLVCAAELCGSISVTNATSTWVLAHRHHCPTLMTYCTKFLASMKNLQDVMQTGDFKQMREADPYSTLDFLTSGIRYKGQAETPEFRPSAWMK